MRAFADNVVALDDQRIATRNLAPGVRVYDEDLLTIDGQEWRTWDPTRSKLGAYLVKGGQHFPLGSRSRVLYLGAANGTTPSHVSDVARDGVVVAVEFSPRSFRDLLNVAGSRPNLVPILADAWRPELYERYLGKVDLVFQDIAQRQQAQIFAKNVLRFRPPWAILAVKARSVDVAADPRAVYRDVGEQVQALTGYDLLETIDLGPFERDHAALVFRPGTGKPRPEAPRAEMREPARPRHDERRQERPRFERRDDRGPRGKPPYRGKPPGGAPERRGPPDRRGGGGPPRKGWR